MILKNPEIPVPFFFLFTKLKGGSPVSVFPALNFF